MQHPPHTHVYTHTRIALRTPVLSSFLVGTPTWRTIYVDPPGNSIRVVPQEDVRPIGTGLGDRSPEVRVLCVQLSALPPSSFPYEAFQREDGVIRGSSNRLESTEDRFCLQGHFLTHRASEDNLWTVKWASYDRLDKSKFVSSVQSPQSWGRVAWFIPSSKVKGTGFPKPKKLQ